MSKYTVKIEFDGENGKAVISWNEFYALYNELVDYAETISFELIDGEVVVPAFIGPDDELVEIAKEYIEADQRVIDAKEAYYQEHKHDKIYTY